MTPSTKRVTRESSASVRDRGRQRPIVVSIIGSVLELRAKGLRTVEILDIAAAFDLAIKQRVARERSAKLAERQRKAAVRRGDNPGVVVKLARRAAASRGRS